MTMARDIAGKSVVGTGAGTGSGRGVAIKFAEYGANVALHYSHSDTGARSAVEEIETIGRKAIALQADFNLGEFRHHAHYNHELDRIELHL